MKIDYKLYPVYAKGILLQIVVFVIGNIYRLVFCNLFNAIRYLRDRIVYRKDWKYFKSCAKNVRAIDDFHYCYDGIFNGKIPWPTYVKSVASYYGGGMWGNCDCFAHFRKWLYKNGTHAKLNNVKGLRVRIYIPGLNITKVHYLVEYCMKGIWYTEDITRNAGAVKTVCRAREVMEKRYPDSVIYTVW